MSKNVKPQKRRITFANIMITLLALGTFTVAGLIYLLYQEISRTPQTTAENYQQQQEQAKQIQILSPDGKVSTQSASAPIQPANKIAAIDEITQAASEPTEEITQAEPVAAPPTRRQTKKPVTAIEPVTEVVQERALEPTNKLQIQQARELTPNPIPVRRQEAVERTLTPISNSGRQSNSGDATGALFGE
ncbi:2-oxoglutarate dehydrogenase [Kingella kingae]|uniref:2-oxoglutarate dehydrogenase n=1 Tax=Kingella kingae TaxID=504 RepID=UPI00254E1B25|nr:2-oxoglutarate dehydrogenase [Kingella kingae]MDK4534201.1 2-oxoglutarate dehydrogenase [Kingella kingae]